VNQSEPLRWSEFDRLIGAKGWNDAEAARQLGITHGHLTNLRAGKSGVGKKFVDGCVAIWGPHVVYTQLLNGVPA
jgi:hypothetical protein